MKKILSTIAALIFFIPQVALAAFSDVHQNTSYKLAIDWMSANGVIQGYSDGSFKPDACVNRAEFLKMLFLTHQTSLSSASNNRFSDVDNNAWYASYISTALSRKLIQGYPDGTFKPAQCVNRVEAIKMAVIEFDGDNFINDAWAGSSLLLASYKDVDPNQWYYKYFVHVIFGNTVGQDHVRKVPNAQSDYGQDQYFYPADSMSRKEVAEMLYRMKAIKDNNVERYSTDVTPKDL